MMIAQVFEVADKIIEDLKTKRVHFYVANILLQITSHLQEQITNVGLLNNIGYN